MRAVLMYRLPAEADEYRHATRGSRYFDALTDIAMAFRAHRKYDAEPVTEEMFWALIKENGIELE